VSLDTLPSSPLGALQTMTIGSAVNGPQLSPALRHSADMPHSWSGPSVVDGHGPVWQLVVMFTAPQQT
jgi:hypothetical protein